MRLEHHLVGGYVRYIHVSPHIIIIILLLLQFDHLIVLLIYQFYNLTFIKLQRPKVSSRRNLKASEECLDEDAENSTSQLNPFLHVYGYNADPKYLFLY